MFSWEIFFNGLMVGFGFIIAIVMQNAFVLKQALLKKFLSFLLVM